METNVIFEIVKNNIVSIYHNLHQFRCNLHQRSPHSFFALQPIFETAFLLYTIVKSWIWFAHSAIFQAVSFNCMAIPGLDNQMRTNCPMFYLTNTSVLITGTGRSTPNCKIRPRENFTFRVGSGGTDRDFWMIKGRNTCTRRGRAFRWASWHQTASIGDCVSIDGATFTAQV